MCAMSVAGLYAHVFKVLQYAMLVGVSVHMSVSGLSLSLSV